MNIFKMLLDAFTVVYSISVVIVLFFRLFLYMEMKVIVNGNSIHPLMSMFAPFLNTLVAFGLIKNYKEN